MNTVTLGGMQNINKRGKVVRSLNEKIRDLCAKYVREGGENISKSMFAKLKTSTCKTETPGLLTKLPKWRVFAYIALSWKPWLTV